VIEGLLLVLISIPLTLISAPFVVGCALFFRRITPARVFSLPVFLAAGQGIVISLSMALFPCGIFNNLGDVFPPYLLVPGAFIYAVTDVLILGPLSNPLFSRLPYQSANILLLVVIPGLAGIILGGLQWYLLGRIWIAWSGLHQRDDYREAVRGESDNNR
jgi:hypothetical protein